MTPTAGPTYDFAHSEYDASQPHRSPQRHDGWLSRSEAWLDRKGKGAWIAAMVLGFVFFWPVGLALLFYMIWSKRMFSKHACSHRKSWARQGYSAMKPSGNSAFDAYKADTLRRLEQEQHDFEAFMQRLRAAKDKAEFDQFMDERAKMPDVDSDDAEGGAKPA